MGARDTLSKVRSLHIRRLDDLVADCTLQHTDRFHLDSYLGTIDFSTWCQSLSGR